VRKVVIFRCKLFKTEFFVDNLHVELYWKCPRLGVIYEENRVFGKGVYDEGT